MKALMLSGAVPNFLDKQGRSPVFLSVLPDTTDALKLLLDNGATLDLVAKNGQTEVAAAWEAGKGQIAIDLLILQTLPGN